MLLDGINVGFALTGSFCTFEKAVIEMQKFVAEGANVYPIISNSVNEFDTKFGKADEWKNKFEVITNKKPISTIVDVEPIGPKNFLDVIIVLPCTGNTVAKIANGIIDTSVTMAVKAELRNGKPVVIAVSTNDGLGINAKNIGLLLNMKNIYLVPFGQDEPFKKCNSLISKMDLAIPTVLQALKGKQLQPILQKPD